MARDAFEGSVVHLLHTAAQVADGAYNRAVRCITPRQFTILKAVATSEGLSQTDVMRATGIDRSTVSSMTRGLVTRGYLARKRTKGDARTYAVRLTDAGRQQLDRAGPIAKKVEIALLKQLPNRERAQFLQLLEAFATNAS
jgi:DNA-binding MarR family transcriptional regulator